MSFTLQIAHRLFSKTHAFCLLKSTPTQFFKYLLNNPGAKILINTKYFEELKRCNVVGFRQLRSKPLRSACIRGRLSAGENSCYFRVPFLTAFMKFRAKGDSEKRQQPIGKK